MAASVSRIFTLAIVEHKKFVLAASRQQESSEVLLPARGSIFAQDKAGNLQILAAEKIFFNLEANPKNISDPAKVVSILSAIPGIDQPDLLGKLSNSQDSYEVIAKKLDEGTANRIKSLNIKGVSIVEEQKRVYPHGRLASPIIGFVTYKDGEEKGEYGIEKQYQEELKGETGFFYGEKDSAGYWVALGKRIMNPPINGRNIVLTVDSNIQFKIEEELARLMKDWQAESALALVLDPKTGRILALANQPSFDPNDYSKEKDFSVFRAPVVNSQFELGSVFKAVTMAGGINEGLVTATTTYTDAGEVTVNGYKIYNYDKAAHGIQTMTQVLEKSLNTGAIFVQQRLGKERFLDLVESFGFGAKTNLDFPGEVAGDVSNLNFKRDVDYATASFGQGIAVTPIQMAGAVGAIANRGILMRPYLVEKIVDANGVEEVRKPQEVRRVITPQTSEAITKMLVSVVRSGFENKAGVKGYFVAGKTGTAQIPSKDKRGYSEDVIHTFIGYAPAFDPRFIILLEIVKPVGNLFASNTLTPAFHNIAKFILNYYEVPPDEK